METVLDALKTMEKATYREVATRLEIDPMEALSMLRELEEQGLCNFFDGSWSVGTAKEQAVAPVHQTPRLKGEEPVPVDHDVIRQQLRNNGAMTTAALAAAVNRNARGMVSVMLAFERQGVVIKNGQGKGVTWSLPVYLPADNNSDIISPAASANNITEFVQDIPAFTARPDDLVIPSSRFISGEIRRTKAKLANLQRLQSAVRELRRHKDLLVGMSHE